MSDHLGSSSILADATGAISELTDYRPYGAIVFEQTPTPTTNKYKFTGKETDPETTLQYFGARYYENGLGRFSAVDPVLLVLHDEDQLKKIVNRDFERIAADPQILNSYAYSRNNPLTLRDADGNFIFLAPLLAGALIAFEIGSTVYDAYEATRVTTDPGASNVDRLSSIGFLGMGAYLPGPGQFYKNIGARAVRYFERIMGISDNALRAVSRTTDSLHVNYSQKVLYRKWSNHGSKLDVSFNEYKALSQRIWSGEGNLLEYTRPNGQVVRFDMDTNAFSGINKGGDFETLFRPKEGIEYFYKDLSDHIN